MPPIGTYGCFRLLHVCVSVQLVAACVASAASEPAVCPVPYTLPESITLREGDRFEYIVVGAGAAGCAVAARLALHHDVLLVEAGGDPSLFSKIPAASMGLLGSDIDWQYPTVSNNVSCLSSRGRACRFSRGKCLGGSTSINYMIFTRGNRRDYDFGVPGWNWPDLEPYFLRYEGLQVLDRYPPSSRPYHNTTGTLKIDFFADPANHWHPRLFDGFERLNFTFNPDVNGVSQIGVTRVAGYVCGGVRMSTARAYLAKDDVMKTLKVATKTLCTGVILDEGNVARGVTVLPHAATASVRIYADKEVILCAGAIGTPQILMLSGIGNAEHLESLDIPVRADLPVGDNMTDHVLPLVLGLVDRNSSLLTGLPSLLGDVTEYAAEREGPLASDGLVDVNVFANSFCYNRRKKRLEAHSSRHDCKLPNMQIINAYIGKGLLPLAKPAFQQGVNLDDDAVDQIATANAEHAIIVHSPVVLRPKSQGRIRLAGADPRLPPAIFPNYLHDRRDVDLMLRSIRILEDLYETPEFKSNNASILHLEFPGCPRYRPGGSAEYWRCYVRHMTYAVFHAVGTCALGRVVDARLRVLGCRRLRAADAGVLPHIPRGNTEAACVALGERLAEFILRPDS